MEAKLERKLGLCKTGTEKFRKSSKNLRGKPYQDSTRKTWKRETRAVKKKMEERNFLVKRKY